MVDFNNDATSAMPAIDIVRVIILEAKYNAREAIEQYLTNPNVDNGRQVLQARVWSFWSEMSSALYRRYANDKDMLETLKEIDDELRTTSMEGQNVIDIYNHLNAELDKIGLTKIDIRENIDTTSWEAENKAKGL